jgi:hypothetical protein
MFSPMRMSKCAPEFRVDGQPVQLYREFHDAWIEVAKRGRFRVLENMAAKLCEEHPGKAVTLRLECRYLGHGLVLKNGTGPDVVADPSTSPVVYGGFDMCQLPEI